MADGEEETHLGEIERKTMLLHGLFSHLIYREAFDILGIPDYKDRQEAARSLEQKGLLQHDTLLTPSGWQVLSQIADGNLLRIATESWSRAYRSAKAERDREVARWSPLLTYVTELYKPPEQSWVNIQAPQSVANLCQEHLKHARLCVLGGAWGGAVQYCSLAVEQVLVSALVARGHRKPYEDLPALQELNGEFGKQVPEVTELTKRLVSLIANFRNDSVHPREPLLRPGEFQARNVYELTVRFLAEVRQEWFRTDKPSRA